MKKLLFIFGTRPETVKLAPVIKIFQAQPDKYGVKVCVSAQHRQMLDPFLEFFEIVPDVDLNIMKPEQTLFDITVETLKGLEQVIEKERPDYIFVQGDTTTTFIGALAGYYQKIKICHVEAGLRSGNKFSPYPEEMNRTLTGHLTDLHFAPTERARQNLLKEGITQNIFVVGNSVIDALFLGWDMIQKKGEAEYAGFFNFLDRERKIILVTGHRRESFGKPFENICQALKQIVDEHLDVEIVYPVHLNPKVNKAVKEILQNCPRIHLLDPIEYPYFLWLMNRSYFVLTDSGGIQEEAPALGKPVLVMREVTERQEGIDAGTALLVGTETEGIVQAVSTLLTNEEKYFQMVNAENPYGEGKTSQRIFEIIEELG